MTTIYFVRHGQTESNASEIIEGQFDSALTALGQEQARALAEQFPTIKFDAAYSSDLSRAKETAKIILAHRSISLITDQRFREKNYGQSEGKTKGFVAPYFSQQELLPDEAAYIARFDPIAESDQEVFVRSDQALKEIAERHPDQTVLVVSHGGPIRMILYSLGYGSYWDMRLGTLRNTGYVVLKWTEAGGKIDTVIGLQKRAST